MNIIWSDSADKILKVGIPMPDGIQNWALTRSQAVVAIEQLSAAGIPILGGDVCEVSKGRIFPNGDTWFCNRLAGESAETFLKRSIFKANEYIRLYPVAMPDRTYFNIVPDA